MRVLVTRPAHDAQRWLRALSGRGLLAVALPLIDIAPAADARALQAAWRMLPQYLALMFVSANAVAHFFAARPVDVDVWGAAGQTDPRAWATGPGTRQALLDAGVAAEHIDAVAADAQRFDSEALWALTGASVRPGGRVLIVRGADDAGRSAGRDWFAQRVAAAGAKAEFVVAYQRRLPRWTDAERALASQAARDGSVWLFSSSQAIGHLRRLLPAQRWDAARAVVTHPRIAQAARDAGFGVVCESRPALDDVIASIESMA